MTGTPTAESLRAEAQRIRADAQHADGQAYYRDLARAADLEEQARKLGAAASASSEPPAPRTTPRLKQKRARQLAQIHLAAKELGIDEDAYRDMLWTVARVRSAKDLDAGGRAAVIDHLVKLGHKPRAKGRTRTAPNREAIAAKVRAQLEAQQLPTTYADGISRQMFGVDRWEWCNPEQMRKVVAALNYRQRKAARAVLKAIHDVRASDELIQRATRSVANQYCWTQCTPDEQLRIAEAIREGAAA